MALLSSLLDTVFPPRCPACGAFVGRHAALCDPCDTAWPSLKGGACGVCAEPFTSGPTHACGECLQDPPAFSRIHPAGRYEGSLLDLILRLKYRGEERLASLLGRKMVAALPDASGFDLILPVPLHVSRLRERGFNQAVLLARAMSKEMKLPVDLFSVKKERATAPQASLKKGERRKNLRGAFAVRDGVAIAGKRILVVDDVATTGETLREMARILKTAGAERVEAAVAARAL